MNAAIMLGWRTKRKIIVIESDDWCGMRMPSIDAYSWLVRDGVDLKSDPGFLYNKFDSLETAKDLSDLFEVLASTRDMSGRHAVFTPVCVVANPDFDRIVNSDFAEYFYEPFTETYKKYPGCDQSMNLWNVGIKERICAPQFHGREHLNITEWLKALRNRNPIITKAFKRGFWGISTANMPEIRLELQAAFDFNNPSDLLNHERIIPTGLDLFNKLFGYRATLFVPPNGQLSSSLHTLCLSHGLESLSFPLLQYEPLGNGRLRRRLHWTGQRDQSELIVTVRNCLFEPCQPGYDWINRCVKDISYAFIFQKPAIISTHRVNYIGALHKWNRDKGLYHLRALLKAIISRWPEAEFLTSEELLNEIRNENR